MMLSPPGHNTPRIHKHNQLTQHTLNVFFSQCNTNALETGGVAGGLSE